MRVLHTFIPNTKHVRVIIDGVTIYPNWLEILYRSDLLCSSACSSVCVNTNRGKFTTTFNAIRPLNYTLKLSQIWMKNWRKIIASRKSLSGIRTRSNVLKYYLSRGKSTSRRYNYSKQTHTRPNSSKLPREVHFPSHTPILNDIHSIGDTIRTETPRIIINSQTK